MRQGFKGLFESVLPKSQPVSESQQNIHKNYYCGDDKQEPISRDLYIEFSQARRERAVQRMNKYDRFETNIQMLQMKLNRLEREKQMQIENNTKSNQIDSKLSLKFWSHAPQIKPSSTTTTNTSKIIETPTIQGTCEYCEYVKSLCKTKY